MIVQLWNPQQAHQAMADLWPKIKSSLMAGHRLVLECKQETRTNAENRLLHVLISEISEKIEWAGKKHDPETWKRLLVAAWSREQGLAVDILPALDGKGVDIVPIRTSRLTKSECADLITYIQAWAASHDM